MVRTHHVEGAVRDPLPERLLALLVAGRGAAAELGPLHPRLVEVLRGQQQVLRAGLGEHLEPAPAGGGDLLGGFLRGDVDDVERRVHQFGEVNRASGRLALGQLGMTGGVELRRLVPLPDEAVRQPADHVVVLGVDHGERAHPPRRRQHVEELAVVETHQVVGHVDLERDHALRHQLRDLLLERLRRRVGHDQVEPVVRDRLRPRRRVVRRHHLPRRSPLPLHREREDRRGPAADRRNRPRVVVVRTHQPHRGLLLDVRVGVHPPRNHQPALRGQLLLATPQPRLHRPDHPVRDPHIRRPNPIRGNHRPTAYNRVELSHRKRAILSDGAAASGRHRAVARNPRRSPRDTLT